MFNVGTGELLLILVLALVVLGPDKLPTAAKQAGRYLAEFRRLSSGFQQEFRNAVDAAMLEPPATTDSSWRADLGTDLGTDLPRLPELDAAVTPGLFDSLSPEQFADPPGPAASKDPAEPSVSLTKADTPPEGERGGDGTPAGPGGPEAPTRPARGRIDVDGPAGSFG